MHIKVSYIIITWNGIELLRHLLKSMEQQMRRRDVEVIITDNGSTDGTISFLEREYPQIKLICQKENKGVSFARNRALETASGEYLLILDNDIVINDAAIEGLETYMDQHANVGLCSCQLTGSDGEVQESCKVYPGIGVKIQNILYYKKKRPFYYNRQMQEGQPFEPDYVIGACQMIRRAAFNEVGLLDENIFYGPEDCDYCMRIRQAGWSVVYLPQFTIQHLCQRKTTTKPFSALGRKHIRALIHFYWKYKRLW